MSENSNALSASTACDFRVLFEAVPSQILVLAPDLSIVAATNAYLTAANTQRQDIEGKSIFDVAADRIGSTGLPELRASLERVLRLRAADTMGIQVFGDRSWKCSNSLLSMAGGELSVIVHHIEDVSELVRTQERQAERRHEYAESAFRLASIIENSDDAIVSRTLDGSIMSWNRGAELIFGYSAQEMVGQPITRIFPAANQQEEVAILERLRRKQRIDPFETVSQSKDGREVEVSVRLSPLRDATDDIVGISVIARDLSASKSATAARTRLETHASSVLDAVPDGILVIDETGTVSSFNQGAQRILGYSASEVIGQNINALIPGLGRDWRADYAGRTRRDAHMAIGHELVGARKDGSQVPLELSVTEMWLDDQRFYTGLLRDVSERKAAESILANKNHELEVAARIDRIGARVMVALNQQDGTTKPAAAVLRVLADEAGYRPLALYEYDEWQGTLSLAAGLSLAPDHAHKIFKLDEGLVGEAAALRAARFVNAPAADAFALDTGVGVLTASTLFAIPLLHREQLLGVLVGASQPLLSERECSLIKQVAGQIAIGLHTIRQFQELKELSVQLNERTRKIEAQNRELAQASQLKSEFLASMSHELRTPLNAIIGFSEALKDRLLGDMNDAQLDYVSEVYQSGRHLLALINDMLDLSKIEAGKMQLHIEPVDVAALAANALTIVKERAAAAGVTLTVFVAPDVTTIAADERRLRQIIYNLLSNAVKFTSHGGSVSLEVASRGSQVEFAVVDTGIGISPEGLKRLFLPFEQLDSGIARKFEGTGLGLVMVKNLVALHGGSYGVASELGKGSRFWIQLPAVPTYVPAVDATLPLFVAAAPSTTTPSNTLADNVQSWRSALKVNDSAQQLAGVTAKPRVLVVDDDVADRELVQLCLADAGYAVTLASDAQSVLTEVSERRPTLIAIDPDLQSMDGYNFLATHVRGALRGIPVLAISCTADRDKVLAAGARALLSKPFRRHECLEAVRTLLGSGDQARPYVMVVDDDPRAVKIVASYFAGYPVDVGGAYAGREALELVQQRRPDLVILDLMMPGVSGLDVLAQLRSQPDTVDLPVIVMTAKELTTLETTALSSTAQALCRKASTTGVELLQHVHKLLAPRTPAPTGRERGAR